MLEIWLASTDAFKKNKYEEVALLNILSPEEQDRYQRYRYNKEKQLHLISHYMKRIILSRHHPIIDADQWAFKNGPYGKPSIADCHNIKDLHFNISHSGHLAALAVSLGRPCGIDIECERNSINHLELARRFFHHDEYIDIEKRGKQYFYKYWTAKEAFIKLTGKGLNTPLDSFKAYTSHGDTVSIETLDDQIENDVGMWYRQLPNDYHLAYATYSTGIRPHPKIRWFDGFERHTKQASFQ
ncbi:4'-phosphopantetheinyl transferase family protein [Pseudomonadota bacterium]